MLAPHALARCGWAGDMTCMADDPIVQDENGRLWLTPEAAESFAIGLRTFDLVQWGGVHYELQGRRGDGAWWVEPADPTLTLALANAIVRAE